ncbi:MAG: pyruvate kinase [Chloroflexi bacterium]|nr:pyruvate kinase [Chloroflexota bacterium]
MRRTKIVCTIGPASDTEEKLATLIRAGMNVARLNFSHGTHAEHAATIARVRRVAEMMGQPIAILQDLQGPKIRTGRLAGGESIELRDGQTVTITTRPVEGTSQVVATTYQGLAADVKPGVKLLLDDGLLELRVESCGDTDVRCRVVHGGILRENKGINLPGVIVNIPPLTEKDREDLAFGIGQGVDYIAISFIQRATDVHHVKQAVAQLHEGSVSDAGEIPVIAKLEKPAALDNLDAILQMADGVMVARGDLGVELSPQQVPTAQKRIIESANHAGKIVITATQMLDSMVHNPLPTRAEASDVANAIFDGTDAVMLSAETASGSYPVEAVSIMSAIADEAEGHIAEWGHWRARHEQTDEDAVALSRAARELAHDRNVSAIAVFTRTGRTARLLSKERPRVPILAFTPLRDCYPRLALMWGVTPYLVPTADSVESMLTQVEGALLRSSPVRSGQQVILVAGMPITHQGPANILLLHTVGRGR